MFSRAPCLKIFQNKAVVQELEIDIEEFTPGFLSQLLGYLIMCLVSKEHPEDGSTFFTQASSQGRRASNSSSRLMRWDHRLVSQVQLAPER